MTNSEQELVDACSESAAVSLTEEWKKLRQRWRSEDFILVKKPNLAKDGTPKKRRTKLSRPKRKFTDSTVERDE